MAMGQHGYLTVADMAGVHRVLIKRCGGDMCVRHPGSLEPALFCAQTGYYADIVAETAALLESLTINHPFVDADLQRETRGSQC